MTISHLRGGVALIGTATELATANPVLLERQLSLETDTGVEKIGDGTTHYNSLTALPGGGGGGGAVGGILTVELGGTFRRPIVDGNTRLAEYMTVAADIAYMGSGGSSLVAAFPPMKMKAGQTVTVSSRATSPVGQQLTLTTSNTALILVRLDSSTNSWIICDVNAAVVVDGPETPVGWTFTPSNAGGDLGDGDTQTDFAVTGASTFTVIHDALVMPYCQISWTLA